MFYSMFSQSILNFLILIIMKSNQINKTLMIAINTELIKFIACITFILKYKRFFANCGWDESIL